MQSVTCNASVAAKPKQAVVFLGKVCRPPLKTHVQA